MSVRWNEYTWYSRLGAFVLFLGVIPALSFYLGTRYQETKKVLSESSSLLTFVSIQADTRRNWDTYTNTIYDFTLKHPSSLSATTTFSTFYHLGNFWQANAGAVSKGVPVMSVPVIHIENETAYPRYFGAEVRVGASSDAASIAGCLKPNPGEPGSKLTATFGGATWTVVPLESAGMMQYLQGTSYRTVRNNTCFVLEELETGSRYREKADSADIPEERLRQYVNEVRQIAQTFQFTR